MGKVERTSVYFTEPGSEDTDDVLQAVARRISEGDLKTVVVASTSGSTGARFAEVLKGKVGVIAISHEKMNRKLKEEIAEFGGIAVDGTHLPLRQKGIESVRSTLYVLDQGFKVAVEVVLIAVDKGLVKLYADVVGVAGSVEGADTAIVVRATPTKEMFSEDSKRRLEAREIIAMPLKKEWWD